MSAAIVFRDVCYPAAAGAMGGPWTFHVNEGAFTALEAPPSVARVVVRLCAGSLAPVAGSVSVLGEEPWRMPRFRRMRFRRRLGISFHRDGLASNLTLAENLVVPMVFGGTCSAARAEETAAEALDRLGVHRWSETRPAALPREARIVAGIARAALHSPELLVLEDPATDLTHEDAVRVFAWCRERCRAIVVLAPADSEVLRRMVDRWVGPDLAHPTSPETA